MIKTLKTLIAVVALSGTVGANVQAAEVTVQKGDTLWDLAQVHNASVENIKAWNRLTTDLIHPGDKLTISPKKQYSVKQGDTLWDIAMGNNVTVRQIMGWNHLNTDLIHPGLELTIFENKATTANTKIKAVSKPTGENHSVSKMSVSEQKKAAATQSETAKVEPRTAKTPVKTGHASGEKVAVTATAYTASCGGCSGVTATGVNLKQNPDAKVISVDPSVIPLGSKVFVEGYGVATAADTGGAIKGNRIDVFIPSKKEALRFGKKELTVTILN